MEEEIKELTRLSKPLREYLEKKYDMKVAILVKSDEVKVVRDEIGIPIRKED